MSPKFSSPGAPEAVTPFQVLGEPGPFCGNRPTSEPGSSQPSPASEPCREGPGLCRDPVLPSWHRGQRHGDSFGQPHVARCRTQHSTLTWPKPGPPEAGHFEHTTTAGADGFGSC